MSALPSPSKSAIPATIHPAPDTVVTDCVLVESAPSQITLAPLEGLRHRMSALPSPLKSPVPAACHGAANAVTARPVVELADFQMVLYPFAELRHRDRKSTRLKSRH